MLCSYNNPIVMILFVLISQSIIQAQRGEPEIYATVDGDPIYRLLPSNAIPAILDPEYVSGGQADQQMQDNEPVMGLVMNGQAMAYSLWQLDAHEIVNDVVSGVPIAVTW